MCNKQTKLFRRSFDEKTANEEFEVTVNGPNLATCDGVVMEAIDNYSGGKVEVAGICSVLLSWNSLGQPKNMRYSQDF